MWNEINFTLPPYQTVEKKMLVKQMQNETHKIPTDVPVYMYRLFSQPQQYLHSEFVPSWDKERSVEP